MKAQWIALGEDQFLMAHLADRSEWHRVGEVHRRQVYSELPAAYHAFVVEQTGRCWCEGDPRGLGELGAFQTAEEARAAVERRYRYFLLLSLRLEGPPAAADLALASQVCQVL